MEIPASLSIESRLADLSAEKQTQPGQLGRDAFMQLLVNQLSNQDPLEPLQDHEFVAQLATFSSLEQLEGIHESMQASLLMNQSVNNTLATTLIGKEVLVEGNTLALREEGDASFRLDLGAQANVTAVIRNEAGDVVRRLELGDLPAGDQTLSWDGLDTDGQRVEAGQYDIDIETSDDAGQAVPFSMKVLAKVDGVQFVDGTGYLMVGRASLPLASVVEIHGSTGLSD
jgi:flagellar basal-body rod modification protein FlgD